MIINNNISSMRSQGALFANNRALGGDLQKLSTGLRINNSKDDAAGLAISEKLRTQIRGQEQARRNTLDGISGLSIADGALNEIHNIMQRQRELAVQAANDTYDAEGRGYIMNEINALSNEIGRIMDATKFNGTNLLDRNVNGWGAGDKSLQVDANEAGGIDTILIEYNGLSKSGRKANLTSPFTKMDEPANYFSNQSAADFQAGVNATVAAAIAGGTAFKAGGVLADGSNQPIGGTIDKTWAEAILKHGLQRSVDDIRAVENASAGDAWREYIAFLDTNIVKVSDTRAEIGVLINRLEHTTTNLTTSITNQQAAESQLRDLDFAHASSKFTRNQILTQSATAMLTQANASTQGVLSLIR